MTQKPKSLAVDSDQVIIRDIRKQPFYWVHRNLFGLKLSWRALITYNALAYHSPYGNPTKISQSDLAKCVDVSVKTIKRGIEELQQKKLVRTRQRVEKGAGGRGQMSNEYTLTDPNDEPI